MLGTFNYNFVSLVEVEGACDNLLRCDILIDDLFEFRYWIVWYLSNQCTVIFSWLQIIENKQPPFIAIIIRRLKRGYQGS